MYIPKPNSMAKNGELQYLTIDGMISVLENIKRAHHGDGKIPMILVGMEGLTNEIMVAPTLLSNDKPNIDTDDCMVLIGHPSHLLGLISEAGGSIASLPDTN